MERVVNVKSDWGTRAIKRAGSIMWEDILAIDLREAGDIRSVRVAKTPKRERRRTAVTDLREERK